MSIKLHAFTQYIAESFGMYFKNIHTIFGITLLMNVVVLYAPATLGTYIFSTLHPDYYTSDGLTISVSSTSDIIFYLIAAIATFLVIVAYDAILSVYAFYITFKSDDENYRLFLSMIKAHLWNIVKVKFTAFAHILIGLICGIIPGIILLLRYAAISYSVMVYGAKFPEASKQSTAIMQGFKIVFLVLSAAFIIADKYGIGYLQTFIDRGAYPIAIYTILYLSLATIFSTLNVFSSIITYVLCRHEADQAVTAETVAAPIQVEPVVTTEAAPETMTTSAPLEPISEPTPIQSQQPIT